MNLTTSNHEPRNILESRSRELYERMRGRLEGLHVEHIAELFDELQMAANRDFEVGRLQSEMEELSEIKLALNRCDGGTYGICVDCEEPIAPRRLQAKPWAIRCLNCQEQSETSATNFRSQQQAFAPFALGQETA